MRRIAIILTILIALAGGISIAMLSNGYKAASVPINTTHNAPSKVEAPSIDGVIQLVNAERAKKGIKPLTESPALDKSAALKCQDEIKYSYYGHVNPQTGIHGIAYIHQMLPQAAHYGENIAVGQYTSDSLVKAWIASPEHYQAMTNTLYTLTGVAICSTNPSAPQPSYFAVEHFAD